MLVNSVSSEVSVHFGNRDHCHQCTSSQAVCHPLLWADGLPWCEVVIVAVVFMLINKQALMGLCRPATPYMAAEITATSSDCPVLKFAPGSAITERPAR